MAQKDKIESFISGIYRSGKSSLPKSDILSKAEQADFAADVLIFFKELPDSSFNESSLIDALNSIIEERGRTDAVGGALRVPTRAR